MPVDHAEALQDGLKALKKPYESFIKDREGHGFFKEENRVEYFLKVSEFIGKYLK